MQRKSGHWGARLVAALLSCAVLAAAQISAAAEEAGPKLSGVVNVNTATLEELTLLPGIGDSKARAILKAREELGGFKNVSDLMQVKGIGEKAFERLRPYVAVQGKTTAQAR